MLLSLYTLAALFVFFIIGLYWMYHQGFEAGVDEGSVVTIEELYRIDALRPREEWKPFEEEEE